jgi:hypothetical protein
MIQYKLDILGKSLKPAPLQGFIDAILNGEDTNVTWLIMADYLDEREIPNRIREYLHYLKVARKHTVPYRVPYLRFKVYTRDKALLLAILSFRFLQKRIVKEQMLGVAELLWTGVVQKREILRLVEETKNHEVAVNAISSFTDALLATRGNIIEKAFRAINLIAHTANKVGTLVKPRKRFRRKAWAAYLVPKLIPSLEHHA